MKTVVFPLYARVLLTACAAWGCSSSIVLAEKLLIPNGNFELGKKYWKGDGEVVTLKEGNKVAQIKADERRLQHLSTQFDMGELTVLEVRYRARFLGGAGRMRLKIGGTGRGAILYGQDLPENGAWKDVVLKFDKKPGVDKYNAVFEALLGQGVVQFDDVWMGAPGTAPNDTRSMVVIPPAPAKPDFRPRVPLEKQVEKPAPRPAGPEPRAATKDQPFENSLGMKFVPVPGTSVLFCIHETRWKDYAEYARAVPGLDSKWQNQTFGGFPPPEPAGDHPVVHVNWGEAVEFCKWLSEKEKKSYRLPTDREWSVAVGLGERETWSSTITPETLNKQIPDAFPWGSGWPPSPGAGNYSDQSRKAQVSDPKVAYIEGYDDGYPTTAPVMRFAPNPLGLYDMGGNVWEQLEDWWNEAKSDHVNRGGTWLDGGRGNLLSSNRNHCPPGNRYPNMGFRVVLTLDRP